MRFIVTGAAGFIGSAIAARLLDEGHNVIGVDVLDDRLYDRGTKEDRARRLQAHPGFTLLATTMSDPSLADHLSEADVVINEGAMPGLRLSWLDFSAYSTENNIALVGLLNMMKEFPGLHLVHASTSSVYGANAVGDESQRTLPVSPYGVTKLAAEHLITGFRTEFGVSASILRYFSVFGPRQRPDMAYARFCAALIKGEEITITGDGSQTRSNTYVDDIVDATLRAAHRRPDGLVANVCGAEEIALLEALTVLADEIGVEPRLRFVPRPEGDQLHTAGDASLAGRALDWAPVVPVREGLRRQARQYLTDDQTSKSR